MTPKEKAKELEKKYIVIIHEVHDYRLELYDLMEAVKQCALIAVDEIIYAVDGKYDEYWQEVKQEIEAL